jgi:hypothetical protein
MTLLETTSMIVAKRLGALPWPFDLSTPIYHPERSEGSLASGAPKTISSNRKQTDSKSKE